MSQEKKKKKIPWFWRRQTSCPDCGFIFNEFDHQDIYYGYAKYFDCPRCGIRFSQDEFSELNYDKYCFDIKEDFS